MVSLFIFIYNNLHVKHIMLLLVFPPLSHVVLYIIRDLYCTSTHKLLYCNSILIPAQIFIGISGCGQVNKLGVDESNGIIILL